jgi:hypothetical protein
MAWPSTSRIEVVAVLWAGILSAPPAKKAAGSIATAISTKNSAPICHGSRASRAWVASGTTRVPSDPAAATRPSIMLRRSSETARTHAAIANDVAVHDKATPINPPEMISASAPWADAIMPRPTT